MIRQASRADAPTAADAELAELRRKLAQLEADVLQVRGNAEREGYAAGLERGEAAAKKAVAEQAERLASIAAALYQAKAGVLDSAQDALVETAYAAVCRILGANAVSRAGVLGAVREALAQTGERGRLAVRLHPQDCALLRQASGERTGLPAMADLRPDAAIGIGGCIVESEAGKLDARLDTQLARLAETLLAVRRRIDSDAEAI